MTYNSCRLQHNKFIYINCDEKKTPTIQHISNNNKRMKQKKTLIFNEARANCFEIF